MPAAHAAPTVVRLPGVFAPRSDSLLLADAALTLGLPPGSRTLDLCTGSGVVALAGAVHGRFRAHAGDISRRAVWSARLGARLHGVRVDARRGSLFAPFAGERFELVTANPPYVPAAEPGRDPRGAARAWDAGVDGRVLLDPIIAAAREHLEPGGTLLVVQADWSGEDLTLARMADAGLEPEIVAREPGPFGPLVRERRELMERRGLLAPGRDGEDVLVVAGRRPRGRFARRTREARRAAGLPVSL